MLIDIVYIYEPIGLGYAQTLCRVRLFDAMVPCVLSYIYTCIKSLYSDWLLHNLLLRISTSIIKRKLIWLDVFLKQNWLSEKDRWSKVVKIRSRLGLGLRRSPAIFTVLLFHDIISYKILLHYISLYDSTFRNLVDKHVPTKNVVNRRPFSPWFNHRCQATKSDPMSWATISPHTHGWRLPTVVRSARSSAAGISGRICRLLVVSHRHVSWLDVALKQDELVTPSCSVNIRHLHRRRL